MVVNHINTIFRQAMTTFCCSKELFHANLEVLKGLLDKISAADVNLHPQFMTEALWKKLGKAPVTYIHIQENENLTMGIFILGPGVRIPLHDHPQMYGLIKVLMGEVKVTNFSIGDSPVRSQHPLILEAEKQPDLIADAESETCVLEPCRNNIHEIESVDGPAAFLDILSPPYETKMENGRKRKCTYFTVIEYVTDKLCRLREIGAPYWFWNDNYQYDGPEVVPQKQEMLT